MSLNVTRTYMYTLTFCTSYWPSFPVTQYHWVVVGLHWWAESRRGGAVCREILQREHSEAAADVRPRSLGEGGHNGSSGLAGGGRRNGGGREGEKEGGEDSEREERGERRGRDEGEKGT